MQSVKSEKRDSKSKQKIFIKVSVLAQESSPFKQYHITIKCTKMKMIELLNINNIINNRMCYTMLCMLELMRKEKHRIGTLRTRGLRGSALSAYIHGGIP